MILLFNFECLFPSRSAAKAAVYAAMVTSLAHRSKPISAADLIMRQPAVTGSALTNSSAGASLRMPAERGETHLLFNTDASRRDAPIPEDPDDLPIRALVFFPGPDVRAEANQFAGASLFEARNYPAQFAARRQHQPECALTFHLTACR